MPREEMSLQEELVERIRRLNSDIIIRPADRSDASNFVTLMNRYYNRKKAEPYFHWQFIDTVYPSRLFAAYHESRMIGCYGVQICALNNKLLCGFGIDLLIDEKYRNRGLPILLEYEIRKFAADGGAIAMAVLPNLFGMRTHKGLGWKNIGVIHTLNAPPSNINEKGPGLSEPIEYELVNFYKDTTYRSWRYKKNPQYIYEYINLSGQEFAVTKLFEDPITGEIFGDIVDFECDLSDRQKLRQLFLRASLSLKEKKVKCITTWALPHTPLRPVLESIGFRYTNQEKYFCIMVMSPEYDYLYDFLKWNLVEADSEIY